MSGGHFRAHPRPVRRIRQERRSSDLPPWTARSAQSAHSRRGRRKPDCEKETRCRTSRAKLLSSPALPAALARPPRGLLAERGAHVVVGARRTERLEKLVAEITAKGGSARFRAVDVTSRAGHAGPHRFRQGRVRPRRRARQQCRRHAALAAARSRSRSGTR